MLEISVSTDGNGGTGSVDIFDRVSISHDDAGLQFLDQRYAQSGLHSMDEFAVDLYDGEGYDGEPLVTCCYYFTEADEDDPLNGAMVTIPDSGPDTQPPAGVVSLVKCSIFGLWSDLLLGAYEVPNPSSDFYITGPSGPLRIVFAAGDSPAFRCVDTDVFYSHYYPAAFSIQSLVQMVERLTCVTGEKVNTLAIEQHASCDAFNVGLSRITSETIRDDVRYGEALSELRDSLTAVAQIHHYGCEVAGPNPYDHEEHPEEQPKESIEYQAYSARRMLATVAELTGATVFASSDRNESIFCETSGPDGYYEAHVEGRDWCLEFAVGPTGWQTDFTSMNIDVWDPVMWIAPRWQLRDDPGPYPGTAIPTEGESYLRLYKPFNIKSLTSV